MNRYVFPEGEEPEALTAVSPECADDRCENCPGIFHVEQTGDDPVFCVHFCHRKPQ